MKWTDDEVELLKKLYPTSNVNELVSFLPKTKRQILNKAIRLKLEKSNDYIRTDNPWIQCDIDFLIENFSKMKTQKISEKLNKSYHEVRWMSQKLKLKKDMKY